VKAWINQRASGPQIGLLIVCLWGISGSAIAAHFVDVAYVGNKKTQSRLLDDQLGLIFPIELTPAEVEAAAQTLMNLGLFESVTAVADGETLQFTVEEKSYLLAYPRLSLNGDGESSYGVTGVWDNLHGLNHKMKVTLRQSKVKEVERDTENRFTLSYQAPAVLRSSWNLGGSLDIGNSFITQDPADGGQEFDESRLRLEANLGRRLENSDLVNGASISGQFGYWMIDRRADVDDISELESDGTLYVGVVAAYRQIEFRLYSEYGRTAGYRLDLSVPTAPDSFHFVEHVIHATWQLHGYKSLPHHNLNFRAEARVFTGGPPATAAYDFGNSVVRGIGKGEIDGNLSLSSGVEYLAPFTHSNSLRWLAFADVGAVVDHYDDIRLDDLNMSIGGGIRWRPSWFVSVELEIAIAYLLNDGSMSGVGGLNRIEG
jgi:outer membrane protein assembly factor BamA